MGNVPSSGLVHDDKRNGEYDEMHSIWRHKRTGTVANFGDYVFATPVLLILSKTSLACRQNFFFDFYDKECV